MVWSTDISEAPRGKRVKTSKMVNGNKRTSTSTEIERVWLATKCGKVIQSYWVWPVEIAGKMTAGRWIMLGAIEPEQPLAWYPFTEGEFPYTVDPSTKARTYIRGRGPEFPSMILGVAA